MQTKQRTFKERAEAARKTTGYNVQSAILDFTEDLVSRMEAAGVSKSELAARLGTSPAYVTKILRGQSNFTLESMVKVAGAVGADLRIHLQSSGID